VRRTHVSMCVGEGLVAGVQAHARTRPSTPAAHPMDRQLRYVIGDGLMAS
jgi:hypothetical protein